jgi:hypothetical protein
MTATTARRDLAIASRVAAGLVGGYAFTFGLASLGIALLVAAGMPYGEARTLLYLLAFLVLLAVFLWSFAAASLTRVWGVLAGGGAAMSGAAWLLTQVLA